MKDTDQRKALKQEIIDIIDSASPKSLQDYLTSYHPSDLADVFHALNEEQRLFVLHALNFHVLAELFAYAHESEAAHHLKAMPAQKAANILEAMPADDAARVLRKIKGESRTGLLQAMHAQVRDRLSHLIRYSPGTAGALMTTDFISVAPDTDVKDAMKAVVANAATIEAFQRVFVIEKNGFLVGAVDLKTLIRARAPKRIAEIMHHDVISAGIHDSAESVARRMHNYGVAAMPVVNDKNQIQGVITVDDAADILDDATDEDVAKLAGVSSHVMLRESPAKTIVHRLPWLFAMAVVGLVLAFVLAAFNATIERVVIMVAFIPLILDMAGNSGTQTAALTVRGIGRNEFLFTKATRRHILKELGIGTINAVVIGVVTFGLAFGVTQAFAADSDGRVVLSLAVAIAVVLALVFSAVTGTALPLTLKKLGADPAFAGGPLMTALNDLFALAVYVTLVGVLIR